MNRSKKLGGLMLVVISLIAAGIAAALAAGTAPVLGSTSPGNGASVQSAPTVSATYDQALHGTSTLVVRDKTGTPIAGTTTFSADKDIITFTPASALTALGTPYAATATVRNADNDEPVVTLWSFAIDTEAPSAPTISSVHGDSATPATGNDSSPTIVVSGVVAGDTVRVRDGGTERDSAVVPAGATTVTFNVEGATEDFAMTGDGNHSLTATSADPAGNVSAASAPFTYTLDMTAPGAPTIASMAGDSESPASGNDLTPRVVVSGVVAGDTVRILDGLTEVASKVVPALATTVTFNSLTANDFTLTEDGSHTFTAVAADPVGNAAPSLSGFVYNLETGAPNAPTIASIDGVVSSPAVGDDVTPAIVVSGVDPGDTVAVYEVGLGDIPRATKVVPVGADSVTFNDDPLAPDVIFAPDGDHTITATSTDPSTNVSAASSEFVYTLDTGVIAPMFVGTSPAADSSVQPPATVTATYNERLDGRQSTLTVANGVGNSVAGTVTFSAGAQTIIFTPAAELTEAGSPYTATAAVRDGNGNLTTTTWSFSVDTTDPAAPSIASVDGDTTSPAAGSDPSPSIVVSGVAAGDTVRVFEGDTLRATKAVPTGETSVTFNAGDADTEVVLTGDGSHSLTATATDEAGNLSVPSAAFVYILDSTEPGAPTIASVDGDSTSPAAGSDPSPPIVVSGVVAGDTVRIFEGATERGAKVVPTGVTSVTFNAADADTEVVVTGDGSHSLTATAADPFDNRSASSAAFLYSLDTTAPAVPTITSVDGQATSPADGTDPSPAIVVSGVVAGDTVRIFDGDTERDAKAVPTGATSVTFNAAPADRDVVLPADGSHSLTATATDPAGNPSAPSAAFLYSLDSTGPVAPTITSVDAKTTSPAMGTDTSPTIVVSGVVAGDTVRLLEGSNVLGTKVVPTGDTSVTFNAAADTEVVLADGAAHSLTATATDPPGNPSAPSAAFVYSLDSTEPGAPTIASVDGDTASPAVGTDPSPTIVVSGVVAGDTVRIVDGTTVRGAKVVPNGATSVTFNAADADTDVVLTGDGSHSLTATATDPSGNLSATSAAFVYGLTTSFPGEFHELTPARVLDTRDGTGGFSAPVGAAGTIAVPVAGKGGVPATGASAVVLNVTITQPTAETFLTVFPSGTTRPLASNLNAPPGKTVPNLVIAKLGADGKVAVYNNLGTSHVIYDVMGWFSDATGANGARFSSLTPARILDTRDGTGGFSAPVGVGGTITPDVTGVGGVPATGVSAVVLNVTATQPTAGDSFLTVFPTGGARPLASNLNFVAGQTVPNLVMAKVGPDGKVSVYNNLGTTHVIFDVVGWFGSDADTAGASYNALSPARILDTRAGTGGFSAPVGPGATISPTVVGVGGVPATGVTAVVLNVTATQPTAQSFLTVFPSGATRPLASNLNFLAGQTVPNLVMAKVGADGKVSVFNNLGTSHVIFDVVGWYSE